MPLETATYVSDLNVANPAHTDQLSQADSHMRLLKSTLKATFPNFTAAAVASTQAQIDNAAGASAGTNVTRIPLGTALLPGLTPVGDPNTGIWSPAADQVAVSLNGAQVLLMGGTALVTTLGIAAAAFTTTGAYSGGTGQLVPIGATLLWWDDVLPTEGGYAWANGQIIASANTVCPVLLARWGTRFGGNGTTTMGVPDMRDAVPIGKATMGGVASRNILNAAGFWANTTLGQFIGAANVALSLANLPTITSSNGAVSLAASVNSTNWVAQNSNDSTAQTNQSGAGPGFSITNGGGGASVAKIPSTGTATGSVSVTSTGTLNTAVNNVQPSTTCNYIIRLA